ncbi:MAG: hypothetical protein QOD11_347 [Bradyrhizobium sp.]|jgi:hypothetical protein|nr:hypothetical protein [Bradyrhizobium sp.]
MPNKVKRATTFRIEETTMSGLEKLSAILHKPLNKLANEAVRQYVARRISEVEIDLASTLEDLRAYRKANPNFERSMAEFIETEASATRDPVEGRVVSEVGPAQQRMSKLLHG